MNVNAAESLSRQALIKQTLSGLPPISELATSVLKECFPSQSEAYLRTFVDTPEGENLYAAPDIQAMLATKLLTPLLPPWEEYFYRLNLKRDLTKNLAPDQSLDEIIHQLFAKNKMTPIKGHLKHFNFAPLPYLYSIDSTSNLVTVSVKIFVKNYKKLSHEDQINFNFSLIGAEMIWNKANPLVNFRFYRVEKNDSDAFAIKVRPTKKLSIYNSRFSFPEKTNLEKNVTISAHEIGHMMGLVDEYKGEGKVRSLFYYSKPLHKRSKVSRSSENGMHSIVYEYEDLYGFLNSYQCLPISIMCKTETGVARPLESHLKLILARGLR